jgi:hypothetical protein
MNDFDPASSRDPDWNEARSRVRCYLRALSVADDGQQDRILATVLQRAAAKQAEHPGESPMALAMIELHNLFEDWFAKRLVTPERAAVKGLVSMSAIDAATKWPAVFLAEDVPLDFQRALRESEVSAAPDLEVSRMVPQPFESSLPDINLPNALVELTKNLSPSVLAKAVAFVVSGLTFLFGNRMR